MNEFVVKCGNCDSHVIPGHVSQTVAHKSIGREFSCSECGEEGKVMITKTASRIYIELENAEISDTT